MTLRVAADDSRAHATDSIHLSVCYRGELRGKSDRHFVPSLDRIVRVWLGVNCIEVIFDFSLKGIVFEYPYSDQRTICGRSTAPGYPACGYEKAEERAERQSPCVSARLSARGRYG